MVPVLGDAVTIERLGVKPTFVELHHAPRGSIGGYIASLQAPPTETSTSRGEAHVSRRVILDVARDPTDSYVLIFGAPGICIRGQLGAVGH